MSGLSGAGKTIALHSLEDMGFYCVDNLPVSLLPTFAEHTSHLGKLYEGVAVGVDARTTALHDVPAWLQILEEKNIHYQVLFLEADDITLIKRFSETRRKHPLTSMHNIPLREALQYERRLLEPLASLANIRINTSATHVHQLRDIIHLQLNLRSTPELSLLFESFGFKYGVPNDADLVFDVRCLPNPHWQPELRTLTGREEAVIKFLETQPKVQQMQTSIRQFLEMWIPEFVADNRSYLTVAVGCTGGQHRSVYLVEQLARYFSQQRQGVLVQHRELP